MILGIIVRLAEKEPGLGRTALMKYLYFLKEIYKVPIDYCFQLYTYGPFDADVLDDLGYAESLGAVKSDLCSYQIGYGYKISKGPKADEITQEASEFLTRYESEIDKVVNEFRGATASDLELIATIIYVDREFHQKKKHAVIQDIVNRTHDIKPRYSESEIEGKVNDQRDKLSSIEKVG